MATDQKRQQTQAAVSAIRNRNLRLPSIDFSVHTNDEGQTFNTLERVVKDVQAPAFSKPTDDQFYSDDSKTKPDIAFLKNHFYREGRLTDDQVIASHSHLSRDLDPDPRLLRSGSVHSRRSDQDLEERTKLARG